MPSPSNQAQPGPRGVRASSRSPLLSDAAAGGPSQKKGGKKAGQPAPNPQQRSQNLQETRKKGKMKLNRSTDEDIVAQLQRLDLRRAEAILTGTALVCDEMLTDFHCLWDKDFPECPARLTAVKEKLAQYGLTQRCIQVQGREATDEEILLVHSQEYLNQMKSTQNMTVEELRALSDTYDSIYLHPNYYHSACLAAGSVLQLVDKVFAGEARNGMAVVRPPGHHAHWGKMNGYCMFNNLAIAARYAQQNHGASRILIVDWDVHHGQGTQYMFEDDPSVLYFSIHRYEHAHFWPHLPESDSYAVGEGRGEGFTVNVPWNKTGMGDADYIAAFLHLLLPIALEFQPHLVLVAAGFDAVIGDPKGGMSASPACFAHLTHLLMPLAGGKLILALEGGYNLRSLAEGSCSALKILLGDPCPRLTSPVIPCQSALASISEAIAAHYKYWKSLRHYGEVDQPEEESEEQKGESPPTSEELNVILDTTMAEVMRVLPPQRTGLVYDERMMEHANAWDSHHPELPQRISRIYERHMELRLVERCSRLPARYASDDELMMCHSSEYIQTIRSTADMKPRDLHRLGSEYNSIFINPKSYDCARLATGCSFSAVEAVMSGKVQNAVAIVRPPGHHAERGTACGFCFFNTAALAARYAQRIAGRQLKVMILDWDVHHGNGTQHIFEDDPSVLYVSLHRYDHATFFPASKDADYNNVGHGSGAGFNVNIAWNNSKMGDAEYLMAFHRAVMPIAYEFNPDLVVVSAGFDAARGDPLGGCLVSPEGYAHMTHLLLGLAGGKIVVVLEGGYNLSSISESMTMCTRTLLGDTLPDLGKLRPPQRSAQLSVSNTVRVHKKYWKSLQLQVPEFVIAVDEVTGDKPVTPSKSRDNTPKPSTPKRNGSSSPGQTATPVDTKMNNPLKEEENPGLLTPTLGKPMKPVRIDSGHGVNEAELSMASVSSSMASETALMVGTDQKMEKAVEMRVPVTQLEKMESPGGIENNHDTQQAETVRGPLSSSDKQKTPMVIENDDDVDKSGQPCVSASPSENPVRIKKDHESDEAVQRGNPTSPMEKKETLIVNGNVYKLEKMVESKDLSSPPSSEILTMQENPLGFRNEVPLVPILSTAKLEMPKETLNDKEEEPSKVASNHVGAGSSVMKLSQLILQQSVSLVGECADFDEPVTEDPKSQSGVEDYTQGVAPETVVYQSVTGEPVTPSENSNMVEEALLSQQPCQCVTALDEEKHPGKELSVGTTKTCFPDPEHVNAQDSSKDQNKTLGVNMEVLQLPAVEPVLITICNLDKVILNDGRGDTLVDGKGCTGDKSCDQNSAGPTLPLCAFKSPTSMPVGGARRKVKPCTVYSDFSTIGSSGSITTASSSSPTSSNTTSSAAFSDLTGQAFSTAPTTLASASRLAPSPSSRSLASSTTLQESAISDSAVHTETIVGLEGSREEPVGEISLSLQVLDIGQSQKEIPGNSISTSSKKEELLEEATGWTNPLSSRPLCKLFGSGPEEESGMLFAVTPLPWCPHLESVQPVPECGLNVTEACRDCNSTVENWVCLVCYKVYCGRYINEHMLMHGLDSGHMVVLSYADLSVWCYSCESYIHNEALSDAKNVAHRMKFGEDVA
ncbi:protein deacetylase HDAC6 [Lissotriton helveticus]